MAGILAPRTGILKRPISIVAGPPEGGVGTEAGTATGKRRPSTTVVERAEAKVFKRAEIWSKDGGPLAVLL